MQIIKKKICHNPGGCKVLEDGKCLEGINITKDECPHFYLDDFVETLSNEEGNKPNKGPVIKLYTGKELKFSETSLITNNKDAKLIVIIGESKSGKTTLLAELFIKFHKGIFNDFVFAGSLTLKGFEERIFLATKASKGTESKSRRTLSKEFSFLHLALKNKEKLQDKSIHLLLSDISGERFREAKDSSTSMQDLKLIKTADHILFIIDGEKLAEKRSRALTLEDAKTFIQKALDEKIFTDKTNLKMAVSKWDHLFTDKTFDFAERIEKTFKDKFATRLKKIEFVKLASRSESTKLEAGYGLYKLLSCWCYEENSETEKADLSIDPYKGPRFFQKFRLPENT